MAINTSIPTTIAQGEIRGTSSSNLYIDISGQGTGTLEAGDSVDAKLTDAKVDRLLAFSEQMDRALNSASENDLFSAGQINASWAFCEILRTGASIYVQNSFYQGSCIGPIKLFRADIINGKITVTEEIDYTDCFITKFQTSAVDVQGDKLDSLKFWFRFTTRTDTLLFFDQNGAAQGQNVSTIDFTKGTLQAAAPAAGGDGGGEAPTE